MFSQKYRNEAIINSFKNHNPPFMDKVNGKIGIPILLYFLGVPGIVVLILWLLFFRG